MCKRFRASHIVVKEEKSNIWLKVGQRPFPELLDLLSGATPDPFTHFPCQIKPDPCQKSSFFGAHAQPLHESEQHHT